LILKYSVRCKRDMAQDLVRDIHVIGQASQGTIISNKNDQSISITTVTSFGTINYCSRNRHIYSSPFSHTFLLKRN